MTASEQKTPDRVVISRLGLDQLIAALAGEGYEVIGPVEQDGAIQYLPVKSGRDLPAGIIDEQSGGKYRLKKSNSPALFDHVVGPQSWKKYLFPARQKLFAAEKTEKGFRLVDEKKTQPKYAFLGVRSCEMAAIGIHDKVFDNGSFADSSYNERRKNAFLVAVNCGRAGGTCFCASMDTGPKHKDGYDIALTELADGARHEFLAEAGSDKGRKILGKVPSRAAAEIDIRMAEDRVQKAAKSMGREMVKGVEKLLRANLEHARWDEVAKRCLNCANCTMVCPTCFCSSVEETTDLTGQHAERWRQWDSCFTVDFGYIHGGSLRREARARYRQWMTHKLTHWHEQFQSSGCTGCGRCITWCPVGIDITEEARAIKNSQ